MLRCGAARSLSSSLAGRAAALSCQGFTNTPLKVQIYTQSRVLSFGSRQPLSLALHKPASLSLRRYASTGSPIEGADTKLEKQAAKEKLEKHPESVSVASSVRQVFHEEGVPDEEKSEDMMAGIKSDMVRSIGERKRLLSLATDVVARRKPSKRRSRYEKYQERHYISAWQVCCLILQHRYPQSTLLGI